MDDRLVVYGPGPERSWSTMASPLNSVKPKTGNTSVARGRALHQHNVWHRLTQMLCRDVALTSPTFWGEKHKRAGVFSGGVSHYQQKSPSVRGVQCVIQSSRGSNVAEMMLWNSSSEIKCLVFHTYFFYPFQNSKKIAPESLFSTLYLCWNNFLRTLTNTSSLLWPLFL